MHYLIMSNFFCAITVIKIYTFNSVCFVYLVVSGIDLFYQIILVPVDVHVLLLPDEDPPGLQQILHALSVS